MMSIYPLVDEATSRGIKGLVIVNRIDSIVYKPIPIKYLGVYYPKTFRENFPSNVIYINSSISIDDYTARKTVFHEIAHTNGIRHVCYVCDRIMSAVSSGVIKDEEGWQKDLDEFFDAKKLPQDKMVIFVR